MADEDRWSAECFRRGNDAVQKANWGLAVEMFNTCVKLKPDNLTYRQLLRKSTQKKYNDNGKGAGTIEKAKLMGIRSRIKKAKAAEEWEEVSKACEEGLYLNPWDTQLHVELAEASVKLERGEIAKFAYHQAVLTSPKDKNLLATLAEYLRYRHEYDDAIKVWEQYQRLDPADMTATRKITELQTEKTTHRGGYEDASNTRDVLTNKGAATGRTGAAMAPGESVENDLRHAIRKEPDKIEHYLKYATHLRGVKKFEEAYEVLQKAFEVSGNDPGVGEQMEDAELVLMKHRVLETREKAAKSGDEAARKEAAELSIGLRNRQIEVLTQRVERYPANLNIKLELAQLLMQLQQWSQAIPLLQKAGQDPRLKGRALVSLAECFIYDKKVSLARGQLERALPELNVDTDKDLYLKCHYLLGRVCEELSDLPAAEKCYGEVLVIDYDYKDARQRLENLQGEALPLPVDGGTCATVKASAHSAAGEICTSPVDPRDSFPYFQ